MIAYDPDDNNQPHHRRIPWRRILAILRQIADIVRIGWDIWHMGGHVR